MPLNPFPDSIEKNTLRRRDAIALRSFKTLVGAPLTYCGLTSAEARDIVIWRESLSSVCAVEIDDATRSNLHINWRQLNVGLPLKVIAGDIFNYLQAADTPCYDVYNLDMYGGFTYSRKSNSSPCRDAVRSLCARHRQEKRSFALLSTFNVRDTGVEQYDALLGEIKLCLEGLEGIDPNLKEHGRTHATKIKLCYMYMCWHAGQTHDFHVEFADPIFYNSGKTNLVHFYSEFRFRSQALPTPHADRDRLVQLATTPLRKMSGRISSIELRPTSIVKPSA
ncbi:MAG: hypothetical protein JWO13_406 [Acidobacteriales bacterium]|nr:hypothetical protein [Terriglobales bacterium]